MKTDIFHLNPISDAKSISLSTDSIHGFDAAPPVEKPLHGAKQKKINNTRLSSPAPPLAKLVLSVLYAFAILFSICPSPAVAQKLDTLPSIKINGGFNDNVLFNNTQPISDIYTSVRPELDFGVADDRYKLALNSYAELFRFQEEKDLDYESYRYQMGVSYLPSQRLKLLGDFLYLQDTTLDSELEESGRVVARDKRERYQAVGELSYELSEISAIDLNYQYQTTAYDSENRIDRITHRIRVPYKRWYNNHMDLLTFRPSLVKSETEDNREIDYYNLSIGWTHIFSETLRMRNFVGYGTTSTKEKGRGQRDTASSGTADLGIIQTGENFSFHIGFRSNINLDADGEIEEVDRLYCRFKKRLTERLSALFYGSIYIVRPPETYKSVDSVFYDINPELSYAITENHSLNFSYRYSIEEDQTEADHQESIRNIAEIKLSFTFPMQN